MATPKRLHELALSIVHTLHESGHIAYFAGGFVRDLLLNISSQEIDIATSAPPELIMQLFPKTISVGIQFGVIVVVLKGHSFEVATFRRDESYVDGRHPSAVHLASAQEDAQRRDFTINGMFYDPLKDQILDFVGGKEDLKKRVIRAIGRAEERFTEDRLRMIRAVRFATRFGFRIEEQTRKAIQECASSLFPAVSMERIWQELSKMAEGPQPAAAFVMLHRLQLLPTIFPDLADTSLETIEERVEPFSRYPKSCPAILYIHAVVPEMGTELCPYLKTSNRDVKLLDIFLDYSDSKSLTEWAHYYAKEEAWLCIEVRGASRSKEFLDLHKKRVAQLQVHIERIKERKPLVSAQMLSDLGISAGPQMGELLRRAESLAIEEDLNDSVGVLKKLGLQ